ncbi:MAG: hypothetical protein K5851_05550 [Lachnospiraceae bacterium]|nr:hypothetical protein [Lachnospiraceae bacterium]
MELIYKNSTVEKQCTDLKTAKKLFGGDSKIALSLMSRINALEQAETIQDIVVQKQFHFHNLENKGKKNYKGYFAIDVKGRKDKWRIIIEPLDDNKNSFNPCYIDKIAKYVRVVNVMEVSNHYE